jgi:hypothetical protein
MGQALQDIDTGMDFWNKTTIVQEIREKIDGWECIELKSIYSKRNNQ